MTSTNNVLVSNTIASCTSCMLFIELLNKRVDKCMTLLTFSTFAFISLYGIIFTSKFFTVKRHIPLNVYFKIALFFFTVNLANNQSLQYNISVPICIVFRSGSLLANIAIGYFLLDKRYTLKKMASVVIVTFGVCMFVLSSKASVQAEKEFSLNEFLIGISLLSFALFASSYLGVLQEQMYKDYGKHASEASFYVYLISMPFFAFFTSEITTSLASFGITDGLMLLVICIFQLFCINNVYTLTTELTSLNVTMILTIRKLISLLLSIYWFEHSFTYLHLISLVIVILGTYLFNKTPEISKKSLKEID